MSHAKRASKRTSRAKAATVLGVAGALSLAGGATGAAAVSPASDKPIEKTAPAITLDEEEISDVSLTTFYVFDNENAETHHGRLQFAQRKAHRVCRSCAACATCGGCGGCSGGTGNGGCGGGVDGY
jgi:hypothetical protein